MTSLCSLARSDLASVADMTKDTGSSIDLDELSVLFGRKDLSDSFRHARQLIIENKLLRICTMEVEGDQRQLTICNLWRIIRKTDSLTTQEFNLVTQQWEDQDNYSSWPEIPFFPVASTRSLSWWRDLMSCMLTKVIAASDFHRIPNNLSLSEFRKMHPDRQIDENTLQISKRKVIGILYRRYGGPSEEGGVCTDESMMAGARALRAALYEHIIDKEIIGLLMVIKHSRISFSQYLYAARHQVGLRKIAVENRNLLPLISGIDPALWSEDDLFSRARWIKTKTRDQVFNAYQNCYISHRRGRDIFAYENKRTLSPERLISSGKPDFFEKDRVVQLEQLYAKSDWRWLLKSSSVILTSWLNEGANPLIPSFFVLSGFNGKAPVLAYSLLIRRFEAMAMRLSNPQVHLTLIRLILQHTDKLWKEAGFKRTQSWIAHVMPSKIDGVIDYLNSEGLEAGLPDKNSTFISLMARSDEWHRRVHNVINTRNLSWESLLGTLVIDGFTITPLQGSAALSDEGMTMHHCVGIFDYECAAGRYRVFAIENKNGDRSTLGLSFAANAMIDQHYGYCNSPPSKKAVTIGKEVLKAYEPLYQQHGHTNTLKRDEHDLESDHVPRLHQRH